MKENTCSNCIFFQEDKCKRNPPQITEIRPTNRGIIQVNDWPQVLKTNWCGEHKTTPIKLDS